MPRNDISQPIPMDHPPKTENILFHDLSQNVGNVIIFDHDFLVET